MPSPEVEEILANYRKNPGPVLALSSNLSDADLTDLTAAADVFSSVKGLQVHSSSDPDWVSGRFLTLALRLPQLSQFDLRGASGLSDTGLQAIADKLTNLNTLGLRFCGKVTDVGMKAIAHKLTNLNTLDLTGCDNVTDVGVKAIADKLTNLNTLYLTYCEKVTSLPVSLRNLRRLRRLAVENIPGLKLPEELTRNPDNPQAILDYYFRTTTEGKRTLNEAKLILVGNEAVGKTSLVNFLVHNKPCRDTGKTPGVAIEEGWTLPAGTRTPKTPWWTSSTGRWASPPLGTPL